MSDPKNHPAGRKPSTVDPSDMYSLGNHEHLSLLTSSESSSTQSSVCDLMLMDTERVDDGSVADISDRNEEADDESLDDDDDEKSTMVQDEFESADARQRPCTPSRVMKASLSRKLMAFTTGSDEIAKITNSSSLYLQNSSKDGSVRHKLLSKRERNEWHQIRHMVNRQSANTKSVHRKLLAACREEAQVKRNDRYTKRLSAATSEYRVARYRTQMLVEDMERTLIEVQSREGHNWDFFRDTTSKWIRCLRGPAMRRDQLARGDGLDNNVVNSMMTVPASSSRDNDFDDQLPDVEHGMSMVHVAQKRKPHTLSSGSVKKPRAAPRSCSNIIAANIRQSRCTRLRSNMRLPRLTDVEQEEIDRILKVGLLPPDVNDQKLPVDATMDGNPFTLNDATKSRLKELNDALGRDDEKMPAVDNDGKSLQRQRRSVHFGLENTQRTRITWIESELRRLSGGAPAVEEEGLTTDRLTAADNNNAEDYNDFRARRIVNYAFDTVDGNELS